MGQHRSRQHPRFTRQELEEVTLNFVAIRQRCGARWELAYDEAVGNGETLETFSASGWDCRVCSQYLNCMLEGRL